MIRFVSSGKSVEGFNYPLAGMTSELPVIRVVSDMASQVLLRLLSANR